MAPSPRVAILLSIAALLLVPLGQVVLELGVIGTLLALALGLWARRSGDRHIVRISTLTVLLAVVGLSGLPFAIWIVVGLMWLLSRRFEILAPERGWLEPGRASSGSVLLTVVIIALAGVGLTVWATTTNEFGASTLETVATMRELNPPTIGLLVAVFVVMNAITEEVAYRNIVFEAVGSVFRPSATIVLQAAAFGSLHVAGFPAGAVGVLLATGYGLLLGVLRHRSGGLRFPVIAHMGADVAIAVLALLLVP
jgi:hypothetical protein